MENARIVVFILILILFPSHIFSYEPATTHKGLTSEMMTFYSVLHPEKFSDVDIESVKKGSVDEDSIATQRPLRHFYDPINNRGLHLETDQSLGSIETPASFATSKKWSQDTLLQAGSNIAGYADKEFISYFNHNSDYSWERAIYEVAWGDRQRGMESLGHILHLIEDLTVPEHVRNDAHMPYLDKYSFGTITQKSPYEGYTNQFNEDNMTIADEFIQNKVSPVYFDTLDQYFDSMATFTNTNFFSKDTLPNTGYYNLPNFEELVKTTVKENEYLIRNINQEDYYLVSVKDKRTEQKDVNNNFIVVSEYGVEDSNNLVMSSYWNILSKEAVKNGAGVIDLFFREVEKEKKTGELKAKNINPLVQAVNQSIDKTVNASIAVGDVVIGGAGFAWDTTVNIFNTALNFSVNAYQSISKTTQNIFSGIAETVKNFGQGNDSTASIAKVFINNTTNESPAEISESQASEQQNNDALETPLQIEKPNTTTEKLIFLAKQIEDAQRQVKMLQDVLKTIEQKQTKPQLEPATNNTQNTLAGAGGSHTESTPTVVSTGSSVDETESEENSNNDLATTTESSEVTATTTSLSLITNFSIDECGDSLSSDECVLFPLNTLHISIETDSDDFDYITINAGGEIATTSEKNIEISIANSIDSISISASLVYNDATLSDAVSKELFFVDSPVLINEIGGTGGDSMWIELTNTAPYAINLGGWSLKSADDFNLQLDGTISARGYFLLENNNDEAVSDIDANQVFGVDDGVLDLGSFNLELYYGNSMVDNTPVSTEDWPGSIYRMYCSVERYSASDVGGDEQNWMKSLGIFVNGHDFNQDEICGTPGKRNSVNYLINKGETIEGTVTLTSELSPYIVMDTQVITNTGELNIEEGAIIKLYDNYSGFILLGGTINAMGKSGSEVVFTTYADGLTENSYGADITNADESGGLIYMDNDAKINATHTIFRPLDDGINVKNGTLNFSYVTYEESVGSDDIIFYNSSKGIMDNITYISHGNKSDFITLRNNSDVSISTLNIEGEPQKYETLFCFENSTLRVSHVVIDNMTSSLLDTFSNCSAKVTGVSVGTILNTQMFNTFNTTEATFSDININHIDTGLILASYNNSIAHMSNITLGDLVGDEPAFALYTQSKADVTHASVDFTDIGDFAILYGSSAGTFDDITLNSGDGEAFVSYGSESNPVTFSLKNSTIKNYAKSGLYLLSANSDIQNTRFESNLAGAYIDKGEATIIDSIFKNNFIAGLWNDIDYPGVVNAVNNDWGDATGPYHETENPDGLGDTILGNVTFDPWIGK